MTSLGVSPLQALRRAFRGAIIRRTAIIDEQIAAMWGLEGTMLGNIGYPWMLTAPPIEKIPVAFVREARKGVWEMLQIKNRLEGYVAADYTCACRFLEVLGFELGKPQPKGPWGIKFRQFVLER